MSQGGETPAQRLARAGEVRFRAIFEQAPLGIAVVDEAGRWREANEGLCRMLGYSFAELAELSWDDVVHPEDRALHRSQRERLFAGHVDGYSMERRFSRRDGGELWGRLNAVRLEDEGASPRVLCLLEDVTARRAAEEARRQSEEVLRQRTAELETIYATAPIGLALVDSRGYVVRANRAQLEGLGSRLPLGCVGEPFLPQVDGVRHHIAAVVETGVPVLDAELHLEGEGDSTRYLRCSFVPLRDASGRVDRVSCALYDVTQHRRYEAALEEASRHKDHFLAVLGHELRNPLAAIATAAQLIRHLPGIHPTVDRVRAIVERQAAHMTKLIDGLLDVSRIARGKVVLERRLLDFTSLVRGCLDDRRALFAARGLTLREQLPDGPVWLDVDPTRIAQVVDNLLTNAMKFTDQDGSVLVSVSVEGSEVHLRVRDTGVGIPRHLLDELFEPFRQLDDTVERASGGLGLGLALVRGLVELHEGRVTAHSDGPGRGAEFHVVLPRTPPASHRAPQREAAPSLRVLVVDDEREEAERLRGVLHEAGHEVRAVTDARVALAVGRGFFPHVIVCSLSLRDIAGTELARALRADPLLASARLVAISSPPRDSDEDDARAAGFDVVLRRPVAPAAALDALLPVSMAPELPAPFAKVGRAPSA